MISVGRDVWDARTSNGRKTAYTELSFAAATDRQTDDLTYSIVITYHNLRSPALMQPTLPAASFHSGFRTIRRRNLKL